MTTQPPDNDSPSTTWMVAAARPGRMWGWTNWQAWEAGYPPLGGVEYTLYTDAERLMGKEAREGLGPFQLLQTGVFWGATRTEALPRVVLRVGHYIYPPVVLGGVGSFLEVDVKAIRLIASVDPIAPDPTQGDRPRNVDAYHGGNVADELASLVSLALGIRLDNGGLTRVFQMDGDPQGHPIGYFYEDYRPRRLAGFASRSLMPHPSQNPDRSLDGGGGAWIDLADCVPWLQRYFRLRPDQANTMVRAARSYQAAMWAAAEGDPRQSWLKLIGAVEAAAYHWARGDASPVEQLRAAEPELADRLQAAGGGLLEAVAERFAPGLQSTGRMLTFTLNFLPPPPEPRPAEGALAWSRNRMRKYLNTIYGARSQDLHAGIPVPVPMCEPPKLTRAQQPEGSEWRSAWTEIPSGEWMAVGTSAWQAADTPMLLYTFEYIVRNVLLKWWESMDSTAASGDDEQPDTRSG
jgi:hypothetical protein